MSKDAINSLATIGERLRAARRTTGLSTRTVAQKLHAVGHAITHATLCNYETSRTVPDYAVIVALARIYERPVEWLLRQGPLLSGVRYRSLKSVSVAAKRKYEGDATGWFRAYVAAKDAIGDNEPPRSISVGSKDDGEAVARKVREAHRLEDYPIPSVCRLLENFGIRVIQLWTDARIDGLAGFLGQIPVVAVTADLSSDRMRMNLAHELGHHLMPSASDRGPREDDEVETWAFDFASHLLIPDQWLVEAFRLQSMVRLVQYKERFGVSLAAMIFRAKRKKLISTSLYERLWRDFARLGWRQNEPGYVQPDRPLHMEVVFDSAIRQKKLSVADIARLAGVDDEVVEDRIFRAAGGTTPRTNSHSDPKIIHFEDHRHDDLN